MTLSIAGTYGVYTGEIHQPGVSIPTHSHATRMEIVGISGLVHPLSIEEFCVMRPISTEGFEKPNTISAGATTMAATPATETCGRGLP